jgi:hypothetical protein
MNVGRLVSGIIVIVLGALTLADGILGVVPGVEMSVFFEGVNPYFKIVVGFIALILGGTIIEKNEKE